MEDPSSADLDMIEALIATMQQNPAQQMYDDPDDDDDEDYDDEDDDDDGSYYEHNIQTMVNNYGSAGMGGADGDAGAEMGADGQMANMQTMNFLQGLLNMNGQSGLAGLEAAIGGSMGGAMGMGGEGMEGAAANFLPNAMQSLVPNMNTEMVGALAGAFAGGMGAFMGAGQAGQYGEDFDEDEEVLSDEEEDEEDDDEDDEEEDDEDEEDERNHHAMQMSSGGLMAAGVLAGGAAMAAYQNYSHHQGAPAIMAPPHMAAPMQALPPAHHQRMDYPSQLALQAPPTQLPGDMVRAPPMPATVAPLTSMSGGTVSRADPLAALVAGAGGVALGAGLLRPIVSSMLGNSGGCTTIVNNRLDMAPPTSLPGNVSYHSANRGLTGTDAMVGMTSAFAATKLTSSHPSTGAPMAAPVIRLLPASGDQSRQTTIPAKCDGDKTSLGSSSGSVGSGGGKSDTESVGKKTPTPPNHERTGGSCASIADLVSATESMRDSDTDNHSEAHNVTANLSDIDGELSDPQKMHELNHYPVGPLPVVIERPTYGWGSMIGLERGKDALKQLFHAKSFPAVYEGTEGTCKGVLLFGPSGSGKTCLARALAKEANDSIFVGISSIYLLKNHPMDAIKLVRCIFEQARHQKPAVILFDEIDALSYHHPSYKEAATRAKEEIYAQIRGTTTINPDYGNTDTRALNEGIMVLGTTNKPWLLEERLRRLFAYNIHIRLPAEKARHSLFRMFLQNMPHTISDAEFNGLVAQSDGYSAADINTIIRQASHVVQTENVDCPDPQHLSYGSIAGVMSQFICSYNEELKLKYSYYINEATHREEAPKENSKTKKDKSSGVKKFSQRIARSFAAALLAVVD